MSSEISFPEKETNFYSGLIAEYLKYGSVDEVYRIHNYDLPISYPGFQRLIERWGIVKAAGPNSKLSEAITFFILFSDQKIPLERLYKRLPPSFKTSMGTLHRILHHVKEGMIRRVGTSLVVTRGKERREILIAEDVSTPRLELGKPFGSLSLPTCYSKADETGSVSILRVLQQEVFTLKAVKKNLSRQVIPADPKPFMYLDIADVRVSVYHLPLPSDFSDADSFSSFKLNNHRFIPIDGIIDSAGVNSDFRAGVREVAIGYREYLKYAQRKNWKPSIVKCELNQKLWELAIDYAL